MLINTRLMQCALLLIYLSGVGLGQGPKSMVSKTALSSEQIAVYRAVLKEYMKGSDAPLNVSNKTEPIDVSGSFFGGDCIKKFEMESGHNSVSVIHSFGAAAELGPNIVLVDSDRQNKKIFENDPQKLLKRSIDGKEKITENQINDSVKKAFETGLFTLSEIEFDKAHTKAIVAYKFECGSLCGNGATLVLSKVGEQWVVSGRCGEWIS